MFTRALHWSLSWATSIQSISSHPITLRSNLVLPTHLRFGLPRGLFPSGFPTSMICTYCNVQTRYWAMTSKQSMKQHSLLENGILISKYMQPLPSNALANKHVPTETIGVQSWQCFLRDPCRDVRPETGLEVRQSCNRFNWQSVARESVKKRLGRYSWRIPTGRSR
jgi:hypothetical protein